MSPQMPSPNQRSKRLLPPEAQPKLHSTAVLLHSGIPTWPSNFDASRHRSRAVGINVRTLIVPRIGTSVNARSTLARIAKKVQSYTTVRRTLVQHDSQGGHNPSSADQAPVYLGHYHHLSARGLHSPAKRGRR